MDLDVFHAEMEVEENEYRVNAPALFSALLVRSWKKGERVG